MSTVLDRENIEGRERHNISNKRFVLLCVQEINTREGEEGEQVCTSSVFVGNMRNNDKRREFKKDGGLK